jgi:hypothetical protein
VRSYQTDSTWPRSASPRQLPNWTRQGRERRRKALCAPRPILVPAATEDVCANPDGQFEMAKAADRAYKLVAGDGLGDVTAPPLGQVLTGRLGYFIREGKHRVTNQDWTAWLDYADISL